MVARATLLLVLCVAAAPATAAPALSAEAQAHFDRGAARYEAGDYAGAAAELRAAYAIDPDPHVLFAWAQAARRGGDCATAAPLYRQLLDELPSDETAPVRQALTRCAAILADTPAAPPPAPPPRDERPWYTDGLGDTLLLGGVVSAATGAGFLVAARDWRERADAPGTIYVDARAADQLARRDQTIALAAGGAGVALIAAAIVRYAIRPSEHATITAWVAPAGGGGALAFEF